MLVQPTTTSTSTNSAPRLAFLSAHLLEHLGTHVAPTHFLGAAAIRDVCATHGIADLLSDSTNPTTLVTQLAVGAAQAERLEQAEADPGAEA